MGLSRVGACCRVRLRARSGPYRSDSSVLPSPHPSVFYVGLDAPVPSGNLPPMSSPHLHCLSHMLVSPSSLDLSVPLVSSSSSALPPLALPWASRSPAGLEFESLVPPQPVSLSASTVVWPKDSSRLLCPSGSPPRSYEPAVSPWASGPWMATLLCWILHTSWFCLRQSIPRFYMDILLKLHPGSSHHQLKY